MKKEFGTTRNGETASCYILKNSKGMKAVVSDFVRQQEEISVTYYPEINVYQGRETLQVVIRNYC